MLDWLVVGVSVCVGVLEIIFFLGDADLICDALTLSPGSTDLR